MPAIEVTVAHSLPLTEVETRLQNLAKENEGASGFTLTDFNWNKETTSR